MRHNLLGGANTTTVAVVMRIHQYMGGAVRSLGRDCWKNQRHKNVDLCQKCVIPSSHPRVTRLVSNNRCFTTTSTGGKPNTASATRNAATKSTEKPSSSASQSESQTLVTNFRAKILDNNLPWMNQRSKFMFNMSLGEVAGNASFVVVTLSFLNTDILMLRYLAMGGTSLSVLFQYYRAVPLWIPIRWNVLLLAINAAMATALIVERREANHMPAELEYLYKNANFEARGFDRVEFYKLFKMGQKVRLDPGQFLTRDGEENKILYLLIKGKVYIQKNGQKVASITPYHFIGELAFLNYALSMDGDDATVHRATAHAVVEDDDAVVYEWDFSKLKTSLQKERAVSNALSAYINHDLRDKLVKAGVVSMTDLANNAHVRNKDNETDSPSPRSDKSDNLSPSS